MEPQVGSMVMKNSPAGVVTLPWGQLREAVSRVRQVAARLPRGQVWEVVRSLSAEARVAASGEELECRQREVELEAMLGVVSLLEGKMRHPEALRQGSAAWRKVAWREVAHSQLQGRLQVEGQAGRQSEASLLEGQKRLVAAQLRQRGWHQEVGRGQGRQQH